MANEITVNSSLTVQNGSLVYQSRPTAFTATQEVAIGPVVGSILVSTAGTSVSLASLATPGLCRIQNLDGTNIVEVGLSDGVYFYPLLDLLPGETYVVRLCRHLGRREVAPGTGSTTPLSLMLRADDADCYVLVEAFNK